MCDLEEEFSFNSFDPDMQATSHAVILHESVCLGRLFVAISQILTAVVLVVLVATAKCRVQLPLRSRLKTTQAQTCVIRHHAESMICLPFIPNNIQNTHMHASTGL